MLTKEDNGKELQDLFWALIHDYNAIYYVNLNTDRFTTLYAGNVVNQAVHEADFEDNPFSKVMSDFAEKFVREEDKRLLLQLTDCHYVQNRLTRDKS